MLAYHGPCCSLPLLTVNLSAVRYEPQTILRFIMHLLNIPTRVCFETITISASYTIYYPHAISPASQLAIYSATLSLTGTTSSNTTSITLPVTPRTSTSASVLSALHALPMYGLARSLDAAI
jgi:hypothetical protein